MAITAALTFGCAGGDDVRERSTAPTPSTTPATAPLGFGVDNEAHLTQVLVGYGMSSTDAECVARHVFASTPSTAVHADGSYDVPQAMLAAAGGYCGIDWLDYDFTSD